MKQVRADKGAIPFVLSGANVMCPGLTSAGGDLPEGLEAGTPVVRDRMPRLCTYAMQC